MGRGVPTRRPEDPRTDQQLIDAANRGDGRAFEALYDRYRDWTINLAHRFTGDRDLALDVMQDTFTYLLRQFPGFRLTAQFKTFLYPVVRHNAIAIARKHRRFFTPDAPDLNPSPPPACGFAASPDHLSPLAAALESLPPAQREVLILRFADDLTLAEIAAAVQIPLGTVKSRLHHALAALRADENLKKYFEH